MFDPFDQVRMRTQQLLDSAARIRQERAITAAARDATAVAADAASMAAAASTATVAATPSEAAVAADAACCPDKPADAARTRAA